MPDLLPQKAMELTVHQARAQLADGALVQGVLEHLWRLAYAAGVRTGQAAAPPSQRSQPWKEAEAAIGTRIAARGEGWIYNTWGHLKHGDQFSYGGVDQSSPICERPATAVGAGAQMKMQLHDTGETVRIPGMCWLKPASDEEPGNG